MGIDVRAVSGRLCCAGDVWTVRYSGRVGWQSTMEGKVEKVGDRGAPSMSTSVEPSRPSSAMISVTSLLSLNRTSVVNSIIVTFCHTQCSISFVSSFHLLLSIFPSFPVPVPFSSFPFTAVFIQSHQRSMEFLLPMASGRRFPWIRRVLFLVNYVTTASVKCNLLNEKYKTKVTVKNFAIGEHIHTYVCPSFFSLRARVWGEVSGCTYRHWRYYLCYSQREDTRSAKKKKKREKRETDGAARYPARFEMQCFRYFIWIRKYPWIADRCEYTGFALLSVERIHRSESPIRCYGMRKWTSRVHRDKKCPHVKADSARRYWEISGLPWLGTFLRKPARNGNIHIAQVHSFRYIFLFIHDADDWSKINNTLIWMYY